MGGRAPAIDWYGRDTPWGRSEISGAAYLASTYRGIWGTKLVRHSPIAPDEVARRQASALFNLVPSTWDTFNFTAVEAMASGRPTIVSTGAGASELVEDGINGFLFPTGDARALAEAIERVMGESPAHLAEIGKAAQETVRTALAPETIAAQRIAAYRDAIDRFDHHRPAPVTGWLGDICRPAATAPCDGMAFLDHHPLREILAYSARRLGRRLWPL
jgi:glycosyltransferase involved in cell wall biosynthesis